MAVNALTITNGSASVQGGGVINNGTVTLTSSSITGNFASGSFPSGGYGGGLCNYSGGTVTLNDSSSIAGNTADGYGGGIYNVCGGTLNGTIGGVNVYGNNPDDIFSAC